eukprot:TRINITY_DN15664_c0_g1_i1.p1 TRINITY_DN15664_c0_g1~~TRINITY_DN15664_c0_g1_i1.p1  ORF type:complete len:315 (+),score=26.86 TRINITY_DN15664_c0_g1_i1:143-1087(+)
MKFMKGHVIRLMLCLFIRNVHRVVSQCSPFSPITVSGNLDCDGQTVPPLDVLFAQQIGIVRNELDRVASDESGYFEVTGTPIYVTEGQPDLFLKLEYHQVSKTQRIRVTSSDYFDVEASPGEKKVEMEPLKLTKHRCRAYIVFHAATAEYYERTGTRLGEKTFVSVDEITEQALPYTVYNEIVSRKDFEWSFQAAQHELGHVIRHVFDGDMSHFRDDAEKYGSPDIGSHTCTSERSEGFAFNEGWAFFWADQCRNSTASGSHRVLGNVAAALRKLQVVCDSSYAQLVAVLEANPGEIHSYSEYEEKHKQMFGCP